MKMISMKSLAVLILIASACAISGCGAGAYQRELLADPVMDFESDAGEEARELKWIETREGSNGGAGGAGGGCACG